MNIVDLKMKNDLTYICSRVLLLSLVLIPGAAFAYVGPGAGLTMLGSLWGLILAILFIVFGLLVLPFKIMRNRMKKNKVDAEGGKEQAEVAAQVATQSEQKINTDSDAE